MSKRSFLSALKSAADSLTTPNWDARIATAEADLATAEREHSKAAMHAEQQVPGAAQKLLQAVEALQAARTRLDTIRAAKRGWEAEQADTRAKTAAADAEREDKATRAAFAKLATLTSEGEAVLSAYAAWWGQLLSAEAACRDHFVHNPRLRADLATFKLAEHVAREITRLSSDAPQLPPGANRLAAEVSDRRSWKPLKEIAAELAGAVLPPAPKSKAA